MNPVQNLLSLSDKRLYINRATNSASCAIAVEALEKNRPVVLFAPDKETFQTQVSLAKLFTSTRYSSSIPFWERKIQMLPPINKFESQFDWHAHISALYSLSLGKPACYICSPQSFLFKFFSKDFFVKNSLELVSGNEMPPELLNDQFIEWGYTRTGMVSRQGEFARRGDIFDIFPVGYPKPIRMEFFGDSLEEIRMFDAETQRSISNMDRMTVLPASPIIFNEQAFKENRKNVKKLGDRGSVDDNDAYMLGKNLEEHKLFPFPIIPSDTSTYLEDWLKPDTLWILPEEKDSVEVLEAENNYVGEKMEKNYFFSRQFISQILRKKSVPLPWNKFQCVINEPLALGIEAKGLSLPEKQINSFEDLFSKREEKDRPWHTLASSLKKWEQEKNQVILSFSSERRRKKFLKIAEQENIYPIVEYSSAQKGIFALVSPFAKGMELTWNNSIILGEEILFPKAGKNYRAPGKSFKGLNRFDQIKENDLLVHKDYGIGKYGGLHHLTINGAANDYILLLYAGDDKLYVPADRLNLIQRFKGGEGIEPHLDKLGGNSWQLGKDKAKKAIEKIAADLVEMYASRKIIKGFHYGPPDELYREFEATFNFEETADQFRAIQDVLGDMENQTPMDRLICGDVGFGKTEVALRAAFRAASEGRQVALLCPTTVLAEQHYQTFRARLAGFPINVGLLSRFVPKAKQKEILKKCETGEIDILIGTHRILSQDVKLPNLALLILDEEQRFGVRHKEKIKEIKKNIDVLTLTATPIPRTLQLSMSGIRDLSIIDTPPQDRKPVASAILERDEATLREIILREIEREGQIFWVYNRVNGLENIFHYIQKLVPNARIGMAHGQMAEAELEKIMRKFWHGEYDILLSTSIIESGLDFPKANTLIVDQAQMFGLSQLYQLRGRVGRSDRQAYAYFIIPDKKKLTQEARERLRIILEMDYLGAGFQVAMEDLRIRGAGNILGEVQTGHMTRVGIDLYLEMLEEEVARLKGMPGINKPEPELSLGIEAHIPGGYIADGQERLKYYKLLAAAEDVRAREETVLEIRDKFGPLPEELKNFINILDFKQYVASLDVCKVEIGSESARLFWTEDQKAIDPQKIINLTEKNHWIKLLPPRGMAFKFDDKTSLSDNLRKIRKELEEIRETETQTP